MRYMTPRKSLQRILTRLISDLLVTCHNNVVSQVHRVQLAFFGGIVHSSIFTVTVMADTANPFLLFFP